MTIIGPLKGGKKALNEQETRAEPVVEGTVFIHADFLFGASIVAPGKILV